MNYEDWINRERKIRSKILLSSPVIKTSGQVRICNDCSEICICHEEICPNCNSNNIQFKKYEIKNWDKSDWIKHIRCIFRFRCINMKNMKFPEFDRLKLNVESISKRIHNLTLENILPLKKVNIAEKKFLNIAEKIKQAKYNNSCVVLMMGAHVLRDGVQRYLIDMIEQGYISCIAMNGAGVIHDFEFGLIGATTESVADYIKDGRFGLWQETGRINDIVKYGAKKNIGLGEAVGQVIFEEKFPFRDISILAAGYRLSIPVTVHVGIGYDIVFELPNCDGGAYGATSYIDFLRFTKVLESLEGGVIMNFGSAVMAPEIYLKALSMVRNIAHQNNKKIINFTTLVCDLKKLSDNYHKEPLKTECDYYFRPLKTMLVRTVAGGGESFYIQGRHSETITQLWSCLNN